MKEGALYWGKGRKRDEGKGMGNPRTEAKSKGDCGGGTTRKKLKKKDTGLGKGCSRGIVSEMVEEEFQGEPGAVQMKGKGGWEDCSSYPSIRRRREVQKKGTGRVGAGSRRKKTKTRYSST